MVKRYALSREDLQNLIHESITFFSDKSRDAVRRNVNIMFSDRVRWIDEFLEKFLIEWPVDEAFHELDKVMSSYTGCDLDEIKNRVKEHGKNVNFDEEREKVRREMKRRGMDVN